MVLPLPRRGRRVNALGVLGVLRVVLILHRREHTLEPLLKGQRACSGVGFGCEVGLRARLGLGLGCRFGWGWGSGSGESKRSGPMNSCRLCVRPVTAAAPAAASSMPSSVHRPRHSCTWLGLGLRVRVRVRVRVTVS